MLGRVVVALLLSACGDPGEWSEAVDVSNWYPNYADCLAPTEEFLNAAPEHWLASLALGAAVWAPAGTPSVRLDSACRTALGVLPRNIGAFAIFQRSGSKGTLLDIRLDVLQGDCRVDPVPQLDTVFAHELGHMWGYRSAEDKTHDQKGSLMLSHSSFICGRLILPSNNELAGIGRGL